MHAALLRCARAAVTAAAAAAAAAAASVRGMQRRAMIDDRHAPSARPPRSMSLSADPIHACHAALAPVQWPPCFLTSPPPPSTNRWRSRIARAPAALLATRTSTGVSAQGTHALVRSAAAAAPDAPPTPGTASARGRPTVRMDQLMQDAERLVLDLRTGLLRAEAGEADADADAAGASSRPGAAGRGSPSAVARMGSGMRRAARTHDCSRRCAGAALCSDRCGETARARGAVRGHVDARPEGAAGAAPCDENARQRDAGVRRVSAVHGC